MAVVWSLQKLRNYLYGVADLTIYTDHQSLIFSISEKNPNTKFKRWKNFIQDFGADIKYKPGRQNVVADALSRQYGENAANGDPNSINILSSDGIKRTTFPLNQFKKQIEIIKSDHSSLTSKTTFQNFHNHVIKFSTMIELMNSLRLVIIDDKINAIYSDENTFEQVERDILNTFPKEKIVFTTKKVVDVTDINIQLNIIEETHERGHRGN